MTNYPSISDYGISARGFAEFFDGIPAAIYRTTLEGKIVFCNRAFARIFGFEAAAEMIGSPIIELYRNKKDRGLLIHSILQRGCLFDLPVAFKMRNGTPILCAVTAKVVLDDDQMVVHLDGFLRDITAQSENSKTDPRPKTVARLDSVADELPDGEHYINQKFQGVLEMAGGVAHSLNQPLTIVNNLLSELLADQQSESSIFPKLLKVRDQINKMNEIAKKVGNIKKYAAMDYVAGIKIVDLDEASWARKNKDNS